MRLHRLTALVMACALLAGCMGAASSPSPSLPSASAQHCRVLVARGIGVPGYLHPRQLRTGAVR